MDLQLSSDMEGISWEELARVFERAPLGTRSPEQLELAFRHSPVRCFAFVEGALIGAGRGLTDGIWRAAIFDVVVAPEHQRKGIGSRIVSHLIEAAHADIVMLFAAPGKEAFYRRFGFRKMKTAMAIMPDPEKARARGFLE